jgi:hypothetical protein
MKTPPPSDKVITFGSESVTLSPRDRRRLATMRRATGAIDIKVTVMARPSNAGAWRKLKTATRLYRVHSSLNAEQLINGGPLAGRHFAATQALLEFHERQQIGETETDGPFQR